MPRTKPKQKPSRAGRPPIDPSQRGSTVNTSISATTRTYLERIGDGSASKGARLVLTLAARKNLVVPDAENP